MRPLQTSTATVIFQARPLLAHAIETGEFGELPDRRLEDAYDDTEMFRMIEAAAACTRHSAAMRPRMGKVSPDRHIPASSWFLVWPCSCVCSWLQVVRVLDSLSDVDLHNGVKPGQSEVFNVGQTADIRLFQRLAFGSQEFSSEYSQSNWSRQSDLWSNWTPRTAVDFWPNLYLYPLNSNRIGSKFSFIFLAFRKHDFEPLLHRTHNTVVATYHHWELFLVFLKPIVVYVV